jgi:hypothetical protein
MEINNLRAKMDEIRQREMERIASEMNTSGFASENGLRYPIFRRTINSPEEESKILSFERGNTSVAKTV